MASIIVFSILTMLKVNIVWSTEVPPKVDAMMTPAEISDTFGTVDGSVPDYKVLPILIPRAIRRRRATDEIFLSVEIAGRDVDFHLTPAAGYLATKYTPVWMAKTDPEAYRGIRYDPRPNAMKDIGEFKMYQDANNSAAMVLYIDSDYGITVKGSLSFGFMIRSLPKRLLGPSARVGNNSAVETRSYHKRSIEPDVHEVTTVVFKPTSSAKNVESNVVYKHVSSRQRRSQRHKRTMPTAVYPEILLVLDHNAIRNHTITEALRFMLAFWNAVDMVYSLLEDPKVHLNIAGIIISADDAATPYIAEDTSIKIKENADFIIKETGKYFKKEKVRFSLRDIDMIFAMTSIHFCADEADPCQMISGFASVRGACAFEDCNERRKMNGGVGIVHYDWMFGGLRAAVHLSAHLFGVDHDKDEKKTADCYPADSYVMSPIAELSNRSLQWSPCSKDMFHYFFSSSKSVCLDNVPMLTRPVNDMLPGRWLTLTGQCRNDGAKKSCKIPDPSDVCVMKGCRNRNSTVCEISETIPLLGSKCDENKYCDLDLECVDE